MSKQHTCTRTHARSSNRNIYSIQFKEREKRKKIHRCHTVTVTEKFKQSEHFIEYKSMIAQYDTDTRTHTFGLEFYFSRKSLPCECMLCMCVAGALKLIMFIYFLFACLSKCVHFMALMSFQC